MNDYSKFGADNLTGDANKNIIRGFKGDDTIDGGAGRDIVRGRANAS